MGQGGASAGAHCTLEEGSVAGWAVDWAAGWAVDWVAEAVAELVADLVVEEADCKRGAACQAQHSSLGICPSAGSCSGATLPNRAQYVQ